MTMFENVLIATVGLSSVLALIGFILESEPRVFAKNDNRKFSPGDLAFISSFVMFGLFLIELVAYSLIIWITD